MTVGVGIKLSVDGAQKAESDLRRVSGGIESVGISANSVRGLLNSLTGAFAGVVSVHAFVRASDAVTQLNNQLKLATGSANSAAAAYQSLFEIAQKSRVNFTELGGTFASITRATQELGLSQQQVLEVTESIANAITVSGASAQASQAALIQLSQGLASGVLRGEELNSVMEQTPRLARALADGLGVPLGKLREMGKAGELTAEQVIGALRSQNSVLARELGQSTVTMGQAFTQLQNAAVDATGKLDDTTGASQSLAKAIQGVAVGVQTLGDALAEHSGTIKTAFGAMAGAATAAGLASVAANIGKIRIAFLALAATMAANPATLALLGIGAVAGSMIANQKDKSDSLRQQLEATNRVLADANISEERRNRLMQRRLDLEKQILSLHSTSTAGAGRGFVNPGDETVGRVARATGIDEKTVKAHAKALEEFAKATASSQAKVLGLTGAQTKLREIMADPTWSTMSQQMRDQIKKAADLASATEKQAEATEKGRQAQKALADERKRNSLAEAKDIADGYARAIKDFGGIASDAAAKSDELTKSQALLRDIMADPVWAKFSQDQREQVKAAYEAANASESVAAARDRERKSTEETTALLEKYNEAQSQTVQEAFKEATAAEDSLRNYGLLRSEVERLKLAKLEEARESAALAGEDVSNIEKRIEAQRRLVDAIKGLEVKEASTEAAKHAADEWRKATDQINQSLTDSLMRGFESGKGFARSLRDAVVNMFKTMVLRPVVQAIVQPIAGPIAQGLSSFLPGMGGVGQAAGAVASGIGYAGMLGQGVGALLGQTAGNAALGTALGLGAGSAQAAAVAATQAAGAATAATGTMAALGSTIATAIPYVGAAIMVASLLSKDRGGPKVDGHAGFTASNIGLMSADRSLSPMLATTVQQLQAQYGQIARALGGDAGAIRFGMGVTTDPRGTAPSFLDITGADRTGAAAFSMQSWNVGRSNEELQKAIADFVATATIEGLKRSDLAPQYRAFLDTVASGASTEVKQAAVQTLVEVQRFTSTIRSMGSQFAYVADMSVEARKRIIDLAGGIDTLAAGIASYAQNFLNPDEQRRMLANSLAETLRAGFIDISADKLLSYSRDTIREWVNGLDLTTEQGQQAYAALMANSEQLARMVDMNETAAQAMQDASAGMSDAARAMEEAAREQARQLATYRSAFLSRDEQRKILAEELSASLSASFINAPTDFLMGYQSEDIRNWVESLDQTSETGKRVFAGIMSNIDTLAQMVDMNESAAQEAEAAAQAAADEAARAFQEMQDSAERFREAVKDVGSTIQDEIDRLRGGTKTGDESLAALWARFGTTTGQARAGDVDAAGKLANLSQSIEEAVKGMASSRAEVDAVREQLAGSLARTMESLNRVASRGVSALTPTGGTPVQPGTATPTQPAATQPAASGDLLVSLKNMAEETSIQQQQMTALMNRLATTITRWDNDGLPEERVLA